MIVSSGRMKDSGGGGEGVLLSADGQNIQDRPAEQTHTIYTAWNIQNSHSQANK
jgi:hypothetical protein